MSNLLQLVASGVLLGGIYALVALGLVIIFKATKVFNFAHGSLLMIGAYLVYVFIQTVNLPIWGAVIAAIVAAMVIGVTLYLLCMRPLIGQPVFAAVIMTLGLSTVLDSIATTIWGGRVRSYPQFIPVEGIRIGDTVLSEQYIAASLVALATFTVLVIYFQRTRTGLSMRAVAESHDSARATGIKVGNVFAWTWVFAAILATIAGFLFGSIKGVTIELSGIGLKAVPVVLLGGLESIQGCIVGGLVLGVLEMLAAGYLDPLTEGGMADIAPFILIILVLIVRPYGFFGEERIERI